MNKYKLVVLVLLGFLGSTQLCAMERRKISREDRARLIANLRELTQSRHVGSNLAEANEFFVTLLLRAADEQVGEIVGSLLDGRLTDGLIKKLFAWLEKDGMLTAEDMLMLTEGVEDIMLHSGSAADDSAAMGSDRDYLNTSVASIAAVPVDETRICLIGTELDKYVQTQIVAPVREQLSYDRGARIAEQFIKNFNELYRNDMHVPDNRRMLEDFCGHYSCYVVRAGKACEQVARDVQKLLKDSKQQLESHSCDLTQAEKLLKQVAAIFRAVDFLVLSTAGDEHRVRFTELGNEFARLGHMVDVKKGSGSAASSSASSSSAAAAPSSVRAGASGSASASSSSSSSGAAVLQRMRDFLKTVGQQAKETATREARIKWYRSMLKVAEDACLQESSEYKETEGKLKELEEKKKEKK